MSNHVLIRPHSVPFSSTTFSLTTQSNSLSPSHFTFPSTPYPLISFFCYEKSQTCPSLGRAIHEGSLYEDDSLSFLHLQHISNEAHFDRVVAEAQQRDEAIVIVWMASWCRKCIYLKPKLEKLAADYYPRLRFYSVDVNAVSHKLVARAGVTKMPTIQLWKDSKKQAEVIGCHKAYLVLNEVQEMIENEGTL